MYLTLIFKCYIFINFIFFFLKAEKTFSLEYPKSLYLPNGNIFVIHKVGVSIYNHLMTNKIKDIIHFNKSETINAGDLSKITVTIEDEYIFSIIKDKIYIFNVTGNLLFYNDTSILREDIITKYYFNLKL